MQPSGGGASHACRTKGYTLFELLVVLVLVLVAATLAVPATGRAFANLQLRLAAGSVANLFQHARSRALYEGRTLLVIFTADGRELRLVGEEGKVINGFALPSGIWLRRQEKRTKGTSGDPLHFFANGTSEPIEIELRDTRNYYVQVTLSAITGRVRVTPVQKGP